MAAIINYPPPTIFSNCSISDKMNIMSQLSCLSNVPDMSELGSRCGNGIVEGNETCDCGDPGTCTDTCCNASTCQLIPQAQCNSGPCCDMRTCRFSSNQTVCRASMGECDIPEKCVGNDSVCPDDNFVQNGTPCSSESGYCFNGLCPTHASQCLAAWGTFLLL